MVGAYLKYTNFLIIVNLIVNLIVNCFRVNLLYRSWNPFVEYLRKIMDVVPKYVHLDEMTDQTFAPVYLP